MIAFLCCIDSGWVGFLNTPPAEKVHKPVQCAVSIDFWHPCKPSSEMEQEAKKELHQGVASFQTKEKQPL